MKTKEQMAEDALKGARAALRLWQKEIMAKGSGTK